MNWCVEVKRAAPKNGSVSGMKKGVMVPGAGSQVWHMSLCGRILPEIATAPIVRSMHVDVERV